MHDLERNGEAIHVVPGRHGEASPDQQDDPSDGGNSEGVVDHDSNDAHRRESGNRHRRKGSSRKEDKRRESGRDRRKSRRRSRSESSSSHRRGRKRARDGDRDRCVVSGRCGLGGGVRLADGGRWVAC